MKKPNGFKVFLLSSSSGKICDSVTDVVCRRSSRWRGRFSHETRTRRNTEITSMWTRLSCMRPSISIGSDKYQGIQVLVKFFFFFFFFIFLLLFPPTIRSCSFFRLLSVYLQGHDENCFFFLSFLSCSNNFTLDFTYVFR